MTQKINLQSIFDSVVERFEVLSSSNVLTNISNVDGTAEFPTQPIQLGPLIGLPLPVRRGLPIVIRQNIQTPENNNEHQPYQLITPHKKLIEFFDELIEYKTRMNFETIAGSAGVVGKNLYWDKATKLFSPNPVPSFVDAINPFNMDFNNYDRDDHDHPGRDYLKDKKYIMVDPWLYDVEHNGDYYSLKYKLPSSEYYPFIVEDVGVVYITPRDDIHIQVEFSKNNGIVSSVHSEDIPRCLGNIGETGDICLGSYRLSPIIQLFINQNNPDMIHDLFEEHDLEFDYDSPDMETPSHHQRLIDQMLTSFRNVHADIIEDSLKRTGIYFATTQQTWDDLNNKNGRAAFKKVYIV